MTLLNSMSAVRAKENTELLRVKRIRYPFIVYEELWKLRPERFADVFQSVMFARIPIHKRAYWMFETQIDMEMFNAWASSQDVQVVQAPIHKAVRYGRQSKKMPKR